MMNNNKHIAMAPKEALNRLKKGNERFLKAKKNNADISKKLRYETATNGQKPYAIIVCCSDSRVPPEHIFNAGVGELFVIRTAGNLVSGYDLGSIEFGVKQLGVTLVVAMGHTHCGAVAAALKSPAEGFIGCMVNEIRPAIQKAKDHTEAENLNIDHVYKRILKSPMLERMLFSESIDIVKAKYDIETGKVEFFNND